MSFQNLSYLAFAPLVAFVYLKLMPRRWQNHFLLAASLVFYWCNRPTGSDFSGLWQALPIALLAASCVFVWRMGLSLQATPPEQRGRRLAAAVIVLVLIWALYPLFARLLPGGSRPRRIALITGSEGGFAPEEAALAAAAGAKTVGLGPRILRCETAPLAALAAVLTLTGDLE